MAFGRKLNPLVYAKYHYALGFDARLVQLTETLADCRVKEYVHSVETMEVIRREGHLLDLFTRDHTAFTEWMTLFRDLLAQVLPNCTPLYLKDKLNANQPGWKFPLHQDASAGWNQRFRSELPDGNYVTVGIPLASVVAPEHGPTRIAIRQGYTDHVLPETQADHSLEAAMCERRFGKPLQYLLCYGVPGSYYLFDQYVLHDSAFNMQEQSRNVFFVTLALSNEPDDPRFDSIELAQKFYDSKSALDKCAIEALLTDGYCVEDFETDTFGKITLKRK